MQKVYVFIFAVMIMLVIQVFLYKKLKKMAENKEIKQLYEQMTAQQSCSVKKIKQAQSIIQAVKTQDIDTKGEHFVFKMMKRHRKQIYQTIIKNIQQAREVKKVESLTYEERAEIIRRTINRTKHFFIEMFLEKKGGSMEDLHKINIKQKEESYYGAREKSEKRKRIENYKFLSQSARSVQKEERNKYVRELMENRRLKALRLEGHNVREFFC